MNIKLDRTSPAYAALEDAWMGSMPVAEAKPEMVGQDVSVDLGSVSGLLVAEKIMHENHREQNLIAQERGSREAMSQALAQAATQALRAMAARMEPAPIAKVEVAQVGDKNVTTTTRTISLTDLKMSREELIGSLIFPIAKSAEGDRAALNPFLRFAHVNGRPNGPKPGFVGGNSPPANKPVSDPSVTEQTFRHASVDEPEGPPQPKARQVVISGPLEFADGLALSNAMDRVVIYLDIDGEPQESGAVWLREARYEIFAEENSGLLIGELRTPYGDVIGRGTLDISRLPISSGNQRRIDNASIHIKPINQGMNGHILAARSDGQNSPVKDAVISFRDLPFEHVAKKDGSFEEANLLEGSNAIVKATRPGYWGTLTFAHGGDDNDIEIFPNQDGQMIHHLVALSRATDVTTKASAIIWGRVTRHGKAIAGAQIELMTTSDVVRPIYFNSAMVPDPKLSETSSNGLYAFFPVSPGAHAVRAVFQDGYTTEPLIFPTEEKTVSRADIEVSAEHHAKVKVFDAFNTERPLPAEIVNPGFAKGITIDRGGTGEVRYADGRGLLIMDADAGPNYQRIRVSMSRDRRVIYMPMVPTAWLEGIRNELKLETTPQAGTIVGFVQGSAPYRIALEERSVLNSSRVIYFDSHGQVIEQQYGTPGGGFVIYNVPEGFRTLTVQPSGSTKIYSSVTLVESRVTSVISHWIR